MNSDRMVYFYLTWVMMGYLSMIGIESLNNGWLIKYGEEKRQIVRKLCVGVLLFSIICLGFSFIIDIFL